MPIILIRPIGRYTLCCPGDVVSVGFPDETGSPDPPDPLQHARLRPARIMRTHPVPDMPALVASTPHDSTLPRTRGGSGAGVLHS